MQALHHALVLFLVLVFPLWDHHETKRLKRSTDPGARLRSYRLTIGWQLLATLLLLATLPADLLLHPPDPNPLEEARGAVVPLLVGLGAGLLLPVILARRGGKAREGARKQLEPIGFFLPRTPVERRWFAALCVTVGVCEEVIFRGFLVRYLLALPLGLGLGASALVAALVFGVDHGYQGWKGVLLTAALGGLLTVLFFVSGSLWLPMLVHVLLDLRVLALPFLDFGPARDPA